MKYIEAPETYFSPSLQKSIFLAGGTSGCPDWQNEVIYHFLSTNLTILNPRRKDFPIDKPGAAFEQIAWEHKALRDAHVILFWFPRETISPIGLYELGSWTLTKKPIFVGMHPEYQRRQDVEIQTKLVRPGLEIVYNLENLAKQVLDYWGE